MTLITNLLKILFLTVGAPFVLVLVWVARILHYVVGVMYMRLFDAMEWAFPDGPLSVRIGHFYVARATATVQYLTPPIVE